MTDQSIAERLDKGAARMDDLQGQIDGLSDAVAENTKLTQAIHDSTAGLVEAFQALQGGLRVLEQIGRIARPVSYIVATVTAIWGLVQAIKFGGGR
jgi:uncharacterized coiled-coil protein SlyX